MSYTNDSEYAVICRCGRCGKKQTFVTTGKFRVNANKNKEIGRASCRERV